MPTDRRFTGQIEDAAIGLYFYNARYYDPALGRFISADSIVPAPGNPQSLNRYAYVLNNPVRYTDPSGHRTYTPPTLISRAQWYGRYARGQGVMTLWSQLPYSGRAEVGRNTGRINALTTDYSVDATLVAASIAQQASDVDRIMGDFSDRGTELLGAKSLGIAQLHRSELGDFQTLGLLPNGMALDPYNPEVAIRGMAAKIQSNDEHLGTMMATNPHIKVSATERWMLLALAQNHGNKATNDFFGEAGGEWGRMLPLKNYQRILRYFGMHLEWLWANGWEIPDDVNLDYWEMLVFNSQNSEANNAE